MMAGWLLFSRLVLRPMRREPLRTSLTVAAVALGVAVVVAIDLAGQAAAGSFHSSLESLMGKSDLVVRATGGVDEKWLGVLAQLPFPLEFTPRIEDFAAVNGKGEAIPFIGLDLVGRGEAFARPGDRPVPGVWLGGDFGIPAGQQIRLLVNDKLRSFHVNGILPENAGRVILADIGLAQTATGKLGRLDAIEVSVPSNGTSIEHWRQVIRKTLPATYSVDPQGTRTEENRKMLSAFRWNLHVLSYIALIVGEFLIYNAVSVSVVRRRVEIGIFRAIGGSRRWVMLAFLGEALFFAVAGSAAGLLLGRFMALGAVKLVGTTVRSLYVSSQPGAIQMTVSALSTGIGLGIAISLAAALAPAFEAASVMPADALARAREQYHTAMRTRWTVWVALSLFAGAIGLSFLPAVDGWPLFAYLSVLFGIAGTALVLPNLVLVLSDWSAPVVRRLLGAEGVLAIRSLRGSLRRTSVLAAALATAVAMTTSVGIMVGSFRQTVRLWMENELRADFYLRPSGPPSPDRYATMPAEIADRIAAISGVVDVDRFRAYPTTYENMPATLAASEISRISNPPGIEFLPGENRDEIFRKLGSGDYAIVSEPFANKHHVRAGDFLTLPLAGHQRRFQVLGVYYDYSAERGYVVLERRTLLHYLPDRALSSLAVYVKPGADREAVRSRIRDAISGHAILLSSHATVRRAAIEVFDRTFRITYALEAVAVLVAVMGIAAALLAMVIDRRRELGLVRCLGAERNQIRKLILCEAGLLGLLSNAAGLVLGAALSLVLVFVINKQSFGWTIQFHWPVALLLIALTIISVATVLAGLYPARTAMRLQPIEVLHED